MAPSADITQQSIAIHPAISDTKSFDSITKLTNKTNGSTATMDRLMESTVELDKLISSNVVDPSVNIQDKRAEALHLAMRTNIEQMVAEERDVAKCKAEFEQKYRNVSK